MFAGAALGLMGAGIAAATAPNYYGYGGVTPITAMAGEAAITPDIMAAGAGEAANEPTRYFAANGVMNRYIPRRRQEKANASRAQASAGAEAVRLVRQARQAFANGSTAFW
jgi:hypothetical protein